MKNEEVKETAHTIGEYKERVEHLPVQKGKRIQFAINRSLCLGPKEMKMIKMPITLKDDYCFRKTAVVAPNFSVMLGTQYDDYMTVSIANHKEEPIRLTGRTVIFEVKVNDDENYSITNNKGNVVMMRRFNKRSFTN